MVQIIEDLIPDNLINDLENLLLCNEFPWYLNQYVVDKTAPSESFLQDDKTINSKQFTHLFFADGFIRSDFFNDIFPIIPFLEIKQQKNFRDRLIRVKANLLPKQESYPLDYYNSPHVDSITEPGESLLYYVNDSDGETFLFNERKNTKFSHLTLNQKISPKRGRSIFFDSDYYHASSSPKNSDIRVVINFLFRKES